MNYFHLVKKMRSVREWYDLTIKEQALYHELVFICNEKGWVDSFSCSNRQLAGMLNISERTLMRLRNRLVECKLISCFSRQAKQQPPLYSLTKDLVTKADLPPVSELLFMPGDIEENPEEDFLPDTPGEDAGCDRMTDQTSDQTSDQTTVQKATLYKTKTKQIKYIKAKRENFIKQQFELFRKAYPGTKRGLDTEYDWFRKKHADFAQVVALLLPAIRKLERWRAGRKAAGVFVPEYPHLKTWIGQRRWEEELDNANAGSYENKNLPYIVD